MPRKTQKPRKAGQTPALAVKNRRAHRQDPDGTVQTRKPTDPMRGRRFGRRPSKFPGRLGGR